MTTTTETTPSAWVGSLHLYNCGHLVGTWIELDDCTDADDAHAAACDHIRANLPPGESYQEAIEELWCFDHEYLGGGECSIPEAVKRAEKLREAADKYGLDLDAVLALEAEGYELTKGYDYSIHAAEDHHPWDCLADDLGFMHDVPEHLRDFVDWESYLSDSYTLTNYIDGVRYFVSDDC